MAHGTDHEDDGFDLDVDPDLDTWLYRPIHQLTQTIQILRERGDNPALLKEVLDTYERRMGEPYGKT